MLQRVLGYKAFTLAMQDENGIQYQEGKEVKTDIENGVVKTNPRHPYTIYPTLDYLYRFCDLHAYPRIFVVYSNGDLDDEPDPPLTNAIRVLTELDQDKINEILFLEDSDLADATKIPEQLKNMTDTEKNTYIYKMQNIFMIPMMKDPEPGGEWYYVWDQFSDEAKEAIRKKLDEPEELLRKHMYLKTVYGEYFD